MDRIEAEIAELPRADRARLAQRLVGDLNDAYPGVETSPDVNGGEACIVRTRVPIWLLDRFRRTGMTDAVILQNYPLLSARDLVDAWNYASAHRAEIDAAAAANDQA